MKPLTEIKNGCSKIFNEDKNGNYSSCGLFVLCPTCQALLEQAQEFEKMIERQKEVFHDEAHDIDGNCTYFMSAISRQELLKEVQEGEEGEMTEEICECGHHKNYHIDKEPFLGGCSFIIDNHYCYCNNFKSKEVKQK